MSDIFVNHYTALMLVDGWHDEHLSFNKC